MRKILGMVVALVLAASVVGCSREVVPPAMKGKIISTSGYSADLKESGKYWLFGSEDMVLLDTSTQTFRQPAEVKMADDLTLKFSINFRTRIAGSDKVLNAMFNDIRVPENGIVSLNAVYAVYGRDVLESTARIIVSQYDTADVSANYQKITQDLQSALEKAMIGSPLEISNVTLADVDYPPTIDDAIQQQAERRLAIETEANQQAIELVKRTNALTLAVADREIDLTKARTLRDQNAITSAGLSPILLAYKALEVQGLMTANKSAVFMPYEAFGTSGASNRIFK